MASANGFEDVPTSRPIHATVVIVILRRGMEAPFTIVDNDEVAVFQVGNSAGGADVDVEMTGGWFLAEFSSMGEINSYSLPA